MTDDDMRTLKLRAAGAHGLDHADSAKLFAEIERLREERDAARADNLTMRGLLVEARDLVAEWGARGLEWTTQRDVARQVAAIKGYSTWPAGGSTIAHRLEVPRDLWAQFVEVFGP